MQTQSIGDKYYRASLCDDDSDNFPRDLWDILEPHLKEQSLFIYEITKGTYHVVKTDLINTGHDNLDGLKILEGSVGEKYSYFYQIWSYLSNGNENRLIRLKAPDTFYKDIYK